MTVTSSHHLPPSDHWSQYQHVHSGGIVWVLYVYMYIPFQCVSWYCWHCGIFLRHVRDQSGSGGVVRPAAVSVRLDSEGRTTNSPVHRLRGRGQLAAGVRVHGGQIRGVRIHGSGAGTAGHTQYVSYELTNPTYTRTLMPHNYCYTVVQLGQTQTQDTASLLWIIWI
jgi:hypothetical protein